jgi:hypothetical protein
MTLGIRFATLNAMLMTPRKSSAVLLLACCHGRRSRAPSQELNGLDDPCRAGGAARVIRGGLFVSAQWYAGTLIARAMLPLRFRLEQAVPPGHIVVLRLLGRSG